jgi:hypothetical protein
MLPAESVVRWRLPLRVAFRFSFVYFTLYVVSTQMLGGLLVLPVGSVPGLEDLPPFRALVSWVAARVFRINEALVVTGSGSGDKTFDWVQVFCLLVAAAVATSIWSVMDRRRDNYVRLHKWFHLFLRFALGSTMVVYGSVKLIPVQMPAPSLTRLLEPFGHFSPMGALWYSVGAARPYEMFAGGAEMAGGLLLFVPRTATLGALVCLADAVQIFALNMTYDVPVKLFSFHLIVLSLVVLAPDMSRLANVLIFNRPAGPSSRLSIGKNPRSKGALVAAQILFGVYLLIMNLKGAREAWYSYGGGAPKSPLYGIWTVEEMAIDGHTRAPLTTDWDRWRRVIFQTPTGMAFQRMNDTFVSYVATIDMAAKSITLTKTTDRAWTARFSFLQPAQERLVLDGSMDGHTVHMRLQWVDRNTFLLVNRGFHWVQEYPFNR